MMESLIHHLEKLVCFSPKMQIFLFQNLQSEASTFSFTKLMDSADSSSAIYSIE